LALAFVNLVADGTLFRIWTLRRDYQESTLQSKIHREKLVQVTAKLKAAKDPAFFEKQARDRFDLVSKGDLVFVFAEDE